MQIDREVFNLGREMFKATGAGLLVVVLSGCADASAEPSLAEIRQALVQSMNSNPQALRLQQAMMDQEDQKAGGEVRTLANALMVDKGQCVPATNASGFVCDIRTAFSTECPVAADAEDADTDAAPDDTTPQTTTPPASPTATPQNTAKSSMPKFVLPSEMPVAPPNAPPCGKNTPFGAWTKVRFFQADGQWQVTSAD